MTQTSIDWLVTVPEGKKFTVVLTAACKGNEKLANTLNYFLYAAAYTASEQGINKDNVDCIEIRRSLDQIIDGLNRHNKGASKKTVHDRVAALAHLGYLESDSYHQIYRIYHKKIEAAFSNPPQPDRPKLRGRHAKKLNLPSSESNLPSSDQDTEDRNFNQQKLKVKSTIFPQEMVEQMQKMQEQIASLQKQVVDLTEQMSNLTFEKSNLTFEMSNLTSSLSHERACREALEVKIASLYSNIYSNDTDNITVSNVVADATPPDITQPTLLTVDPGKKTENKKTTKRQTEEKPMKKQAEIVELDADEQAFNDLYCQMWYIATPPKVTPTYKKNCGILAKTIKTLDQLKSLDKLARAKQNITNRVVYPGNLVNSLNDWLQINVPEEDTKNTDQSSQSFSYKNMSKPELIAFILSCPTGLKQTDPQYIEMEKAKLYLTPEEKREVIMQRRKLQSQRLQQPIAS